MKKIAWLACGVSLLAVQGVADFLYWQGVGGSGVGEYDVPSNWTSNSVPTAADLVAFKNYGSQNWACTLNSDVTNTIILNDASTQNYQNLFNLNGHVWTATESFQGLYVRYGTGGRVTFTNGALRLVMLNCQSAPFSGSTPTNHAVIAFQNIHSESVNAYFAGSIAAFDGGEHTVSNQLRVGTISGTSAYSTLNLLNGTQVIVTNEMHIGETGGATGRVNVADAALKMGKVANYIGLATGSKGTLSVGADADVFSSGPVVVGNNGSGVLEQTGGTCVITNGFDIAENSGSRGEFAQSGGQFTMVTNYFRVAVNSGSTGEVTLAGGTFSYTGAASLIGRAGYGKLTVTGGTNLFGNGFVLGANAGGVGDMTVLGGTNTFSSGTGQRVQVGGYGRGTLLVLGGTNSAGNIAVANDAGSSGAMTVSNGLWTIAEHSWIGNSGNGTLTVTGGELRYLNSGPVLAIGRYGVATGEVTVAGGLVDMGGNGAVWVGRADQTKNAGRLVLTGTGVLRTRQIFEHTPGPTSASRILFDGGTLKASASGTLVYSIDDVRLTANGMVIDSTGFNVSVATVLQDAAGEAGGITKKGAGTLTLAADRNATGPVSVLGGTLVVSNGVAVAAGTSRIDGTLTLSAANRLTVGAGAALAGTGTVARVTLQDNAVFARDKADGAVTPLLVSDDCVAEDHVTVALTGYSLTEVETPVPLLRAPTAFMSPSKVTVLLNGQENAFLKAKFVEVSGQQLLVVTYSTGTLIRVM